MANYIRILFIILLSFVSGFSAGAIEEIPVEKSDSLMSDTIVSDTPEFYILESSNQNQSGKKDSEVNTSVMGKDYFKPDPKKATWYAIVCPGLGQIYNRSYWKLPILYGGMMTFTYLIGWNGRMYNDYHDAYHDILDADPETNSYLIFYPQYDGTQLWLQSTLKTKTNRYRRARDLSTFGLVAFYLVSVVDAFVDAHLYDFSVTDDLSMRIEPVINTYGIDGMGGVFDARQNSFVGIQCSIHFK